MSPALITVETTEAQVVFQGNVGVGLPGLSRVSGDLSAAWPAISASVRESIAENFQVQGSFRGKWASLSPAYARWKARHYPGKGILDRGGSLRSSWTEEFGEGRVQVETPNSLFITSNVAYGRYHQQGTGSMPARPFISLSPQQKARLGGAIHRALSRDVYGLATPGARPSVRRALTGF